MLQETCIKSLDIRAQMDKHRLPLVSIIITTYNRSELLIRALNSVVNQTYENIEILVIDDASIDNTSTVVTKYIKDYTNIIYIQKEMTTGANDSRNIGIKRASGTFIAGLDDDDEFSINRIARFVEEYDSKYAFLSSLSILKNQDKMDYSKALSITTLKDMYQDNTIAQGFIEKKRLIDVGLYDTDLSAYQDYDMWLRLMLKYGNVKVIQEYLQTIYIEENRERITTNTRQRFSGYFNFYIKHKCLFSIEERKNKLFMLYRIRNKSLSKETLMTLCTNFNKDEIFLYYEFSSHNSYIVLQKFYKFMSDIDMNKKYIIYGYGSVGKMLFKHIKDNTLGIIDSSIEEKYIKNVSVILLEDLKNYKDANIIITPFRYNFNILKKLKKFNLNIYMVRL